MTVDITEMNAMEYLLYYLTQIRMILDMWQIPFLGCSYWDFCMGVAITAVVITVLVNVVRIGTVSYSNSRYSKNDRPSASSLYTPSKTTVKMNDGFGGKYNDTYGKSSGGIWVKR